jgi:hypothetical protein
VVYIAEINLSLVVGVKLFNEFYGSVLRKNYFAKLLVVSFEADLIYGAVWEVHSLIVEKKTFPIYRQRTCLFIGQFYGIPHFANSLNFLSLFCGGKLGRTKNLTCSATRERKIIMWKNMKMHK